MKYFTLKLTKSQIDNLLTYLKDYLTVSNNPNCLYQAKYEGNIFTVYTSGTLLIAGEDISGAINWVKKTIGVKDYEAIGSDEVGTGDLFGPVVVCSCLVRLEDFSLINDLNVRDSKKISNSEILKIGPILAKKLIHSLFIIPPKEYNKLIRENNNLNKIKALYHNHAFLNVISKYPKPVPIILDQFCSKENYFKYLENSKFIHRDIIFKEKGENFHPAVACASIIARYAFIVKLKQYSNKLHLGLPKGASEKATEVLTTLIKIYGEEIINVVAKGNFKNVQDALLAINKN